MVATAEMPLLHTAVWTGHVFALSRDCWTYVRIYRVIQRARQVREQLPIPTFGPAACDYVRGRLPNADDGLDHSASPRCHMLKILTQKLEIPQIPQAPYAP